MKNNKGYTLVELLVTLAVFALIMAELGNMMMNSSKLYRNGTYEVELQTEAQQIVQQMEEFLMDVNHSVSTNYQPSVSSDYITVSNNSKGLDGTGVSTVYYFTVDKDPELGYGTLYFNRTGPEGDVSGIPMAEYVQSISLNMENYAYDIVTLNVSMNNGRYGYQTSQDIYLRNQVGSGGGGNYSVGSSCDVDVDILRLRVYNLNHYLPEGAPSDMVFEWSDANPSSPDPRNSYELSPSGSIQVASAVAYGRNELGAFIVKAYSASDPNKSYTLRVSTKKLEVGTAVGSTGRAIFMTRADGSGGSFPNMTPIPVQGVAVEAAKVTITLRYLKTPGGDDNMAEYTMNSNVMTANLGFSGEMKYDNNGDYLVQFKGNGLNFEKDANMNCFQIEHEGISGGGNVVQQYYNYIDNLNRTIFLELDFDWGHGLTYKCYAHMYVVTTGSTHMPPDTSQRFWNYVGL